MRRPPGATRASTSTISAREGRQRAAEAAEKGREFFNQGRDTIANAIERGREAYEQARERDNA